jgi:energy-coupling factor transport system permease protein
MESRSLHAVTWVVWTGATAAGLMLIGNPLYLALLLGVVTVYYMAAVTEHPQERGWGMLLRFALWLVLLVIPLNALTIHVGSHVLFRLPDHWPLVGGIVALEGVLAGLVNALRLFALTLLFVCFNLEISQAELLRLVPAFVYEAGLVLSIGLTFVPQMMLSAREIREAQLVRGYRMRRVRDARPFVMALLTVGLERSFALAESMESRGFGRMRAQPSWRDLVAKAASVLGLGAVLSGLFLQTYYASMREIGRWIAVAGGGLLLGVFWAQGRRVLRVHYRTAKWSWRDGIALSACAGIVGALAFAGVRSPGVLAYSPYQNIAPAFDPLVGIVLMLYLVPLSIRSRWR